jgi:hypothetical protein
MRRYATVFALLLFACSLHAAEVLVVAGSASGGRNACGGPLYFWSTETVAHNLGDAPATVALLAFSNAFEPSVPPPPVTIAPGESRSLPFFGDVPSTPVYATRLDVGDGIRIESRLHYSYDSCAGAPPLGPAGKMALPVFDELTPSGARQVHLGTDLGLQASRVNVGIYNAAQTAAVAVIAVRRPACHEGGEGTTTVTIPPDSLIQVAAPVPPVCPTPDSSLQPYVTYTTVTVDQPSFSYAIALSRAQGPNVSFALGSGAN